MFFNIINALLFSFFFLSLVVSMLDDDDRKLTIFKLSALMLIAWSFLIGFIECAAVLISIIGNIFKYFLS